MMRSMYASVSGLKVHQTMMDVLGNNISNINTVGFKGSRPTFKQMLTQTQKGATSPNEEKGKGGTNPVQIGLGVSMGSVDTDMSSGNLKPTGKKTDVAIQGDGFFVVNNGEENCFSRAGSLSFDKNGYLYSSTSGFRIQGWKANEKGNFSNMTPDNIKDITLDNSMEPEATTEINYGGNLDSATVDKFNMITSKFKTEDGGGNKLTDVQVELSQGPNFHEYKFTLTPTESGIQIDGNDSYTGYITLNKKGDEIDSVYTDPDKTGTDLTGSSLNVDGGTDSIMMPASGDDSEGKIFTSSNNTSETVKGSYEQTAETSIVTDVFDIKGKKHTVNIDLEKNGENKWVIKENNIEVSKADPNGSWLGGSDHEILFEKGKIVDGETVKLNLDPYNAQTQEVTLDFSKLTQFAGSMTADFNTVDGYAQGSLQNIAVDEQGNVNGSFDNGQKKALAKIALASFKNPSGLQKEGGVFKVSNNSGLARIGVPGTKGRGKLAPGTLEMSNVDLSEQFTKMITAQRGFQANSKLISTSDQMMQQLVNLRR